jgi:Nucleoside-diphosphate-sugar epimerases
MEFNTENYKDKLENKSILISGGAGFIGSWLSETLVNFNLNVTVLDNLETGNINNIKNLMGKNNFKFLKADVQNYRTEERFDLIVHAASIPSPDLYIKKPIETMLPNSIGTLNLLEICRKTDSTFIYLSTSEVYGNAELIPTPETYFGLVNPIGIRSCYDESKRFGEALCMAYFREYNLDVRIVRIFNTYGPRIEINSSYSRVIPRFIVQSLKNEDITIFGTGLQTRSFLYIDDLLDALLRMLTFENIKGEVFNIGSDKEIKIIDLAKIVIKLTNSKSSIKYLPPRPDDPVRRCPDISKAKQTLKWFPKTELNEGLIKTIYWIKENAR